MEGRLAAGKAGAIRLKRVDMVWIWNVYSFGDKFRIIAVINAVACTQNADSVRNKTRLVLV